MCKSELIARRIIAIAHQKRLNKKQLAALLQVNPSIITRWLSGQHNFTIETITKIEHTLEEPILVVVKN